MSGVKPDPQSVVRFYPGERWRPFVALLLRRGPGGARNPSMKTLPSLGLALAAILLGAAPMTRSADVTAPRNQAFLHDFFAAFSARDGSRLAEFYTADAVFEDPSFELDLHGPAAIRELFTTGLAKYASLGFELAHTLAAGDDLIVEGTMVGVLRTKTIRVRFVSVFHFTDGKISSQRDLYDVLHFYAQLGIVPPQFRPKAAAVPAHS